MKKIINGKLYDTDTAKEFGTYLNGYDYTDLRRMRETLYKKKTGEFFLYGCGGPMSKYAESCGNTTCSGAAIIPLTLDEAKKWAEEHINPDVYIEIFGEVEE